MVSFLTAWSEYWIEPKKKKKICKICMFKWEMQYNKWK